MKTKDIVQGMQILAPYYDDPDGYNIGAEHDQIYLFATDRPLPPEDVKKMHDLGWFQENMDDEDDDGSGEASKTYDPEESWTAYV
jgi:hypothetical protein